jgi:hypothetical protein
LALTIVGGFIMYGNFWVIIGSYWLSIYVY